MNFFSEEPAHLPWDGQYYFNVLVINIGTSNAIDADEDTFLDIWYIEALTCPRPIVVHLYYDDELEEPTITYHPHSVVEISPTLGVSWYSMGDIESEDPWRIG